MLRIVKILHRCAAGERGCERARVPHSQIYHLTHYVTHSLTVSLVHALCHSLMPLTHALCDSLARAPPLLAALIQQIIAAAKLRREPRRALQQPHLVHSLQTGFSFSESDTDTHFIS